MLFLLSPAKSLDYDSPAGDVPHTLPQFTEQVRDGKMAASTAARQLLQAFQGQAGQ